MENNGESRIPVSQETDKPTISLRELEIDVSAFIHFLSEHYGGEIQSEIPSFWMLIPKSIDVDWRKGTKEFFLEKEVFSRKIYIVAEPVPEPEKQRRRAELLSIFQNAIAEDQTKQILLLLSRLRPDSREVMIDEFQKYKSRSNPDRPENKSK